MSVHRTKDGQAEQRCKEADKDTREGDRNIEPTETFEPSSFHKRIELTLYHKVTNVKPPKS